MSKLITFLSQLTHESDNAFQNRCFPLGIGSIAAHLKHSLSDKVDVEVFKQPSDLNQKLILQKPDICLFSIFIWNEALSLAYAKRIKEKYPDTLIIFGGPNISIEYKKNIEFLKNNPFVDLLVLTEGEIITLKIVNDFYEFHDIEKLKSSYYPSTLAISGQNIFLGDLTPDKKHFNDWPCNKNIEIRPGARKSDNSLDDISSPYLSGLFDKFFIDGEIPLIETNRGCPFKCTFCQQGAVSPGKTRFRAIDIVKKELLYIAKKIQELDVEIHMLEVADSNFLMYSEDSDVVKAIREIQDEYLYPAYIGSSTGKNKLDRILKSASNLKQGSMFLRISVQSMDENTLASIKRSNIKKEYYLKINEDLHSRDEESNADVMLCLPGETIDAHFKGIYTLLDSGINEFANLQTIVLKGTEMELHSYLKLYGMVTKKRVIPECYNQYDILGQEIFIAELEQIIVATESMSFEQYLESRKLHLIMMIFHNTRLLSHIYTFLDNLGIKRSILIEMIYNKSEQYIREVICQFLDATKAELITDFQPESDNLDVYTSNKIFRYLSVALYQYSNNLIELLQESLHSILPDEYRQNINELVHIFKLRIIPLDYKNLSYIFNINTDLNKQLFGKEILIYLSDKQKKSLDLFYDIYTNEEERINKMAYHLRPKNMSYMFSINQSDII